MTQQFPSKQVAVGVLLPANWKLLLQSQNKTYIYAILFKVWINTVETV